MTRGFNTGGLVSQFTPVDPRYAVQDPTAMFRGIQGGMGLLRDIEADAILRGDRPRQQLLRDIELAKAQSEMANMPRVNRLKDIELAEKERKARIGLLEPEEWRGNQTTELDADGNLVKFEEVNSTYEGIPFRAKAQVGVVETAAERELKQRMNAALAGQRIAYGEARLKDAETRANRPTSAYAPKPGQTVPYAPLGRDVIWSASPDKIIDAQSGLPVFLSKENYATGTKELVKNPAVWDAVESGEDVVAQSVFGATTPAPTSGIKTGGTTVPAPAKITGTQAPANAVPTVEFIPPERSFATANDAMAAVQSGQIQPGQWIMIGGVRKFVAEE